MHKLHLPLILVQVCINTVLDVGGIPGATSVGPVLPNDRWLQAACGERMVVVRSSIQPSWSPDASQPEQWIHTCLPTIPRLCAPGMCRGGCPIWVFQWPVLRVLSNSFMFHHFLRALKCMVLLHVGCFVCLHVFFVQLSCLNLFLESSYLVYCKNSSDVLLGVDKELSPHSCTVLSTKREKE